METTQALTRIHPLMAGAAASVMLVSLVGVAAMTGLLPNSHGTVPPVASTSPVISVAQPVAAPAISAPAANQPVVEARAPTPIAHRTVHHRVAAAPVAPTVYAQAEQVRQPAPVYQAPAPVARYSPVGIGLGAVAGGLIGNQVGGGNGRTLATIVGAVGGGYVGNEVAKRY
ncbi:MAG: 17 kDa surface antigen [Herminiimonas sp.]|nr:17 kDa surface antigen [Herminiimonas sp.]MDB5852269.1 17 kDa surface antigen [Herminiimonas sp.]